MSRLSLGVCGITLVRADHFSYGSGERYITMDKALVKAGKRHLWGSKGSARQARKNRKRMNRESLK